jgi:GNAT superfamily N-acetyltransferase
MFIINYINLNRDELPADLPYSKSWMIETVYTDENYRGLGISSKLMKDALIKGKEYNSPRSMIIVALGNDKAKSIYLKNGFKDIGVMTSENCLEQMGTAGFDIMSQDF